MANEKQLIYADELMSDVYRSDEQQKTDVWHTSDIEYLVMAQPTVDAVEVVHGYWIDSHSVDHTGRITGHGIDCSVCDSVFKDDRRDVVQHWKKEFKRCPFCGAVMDGGNEDG